MTKEQKICVKKVLGEVAKFICECLCVCLLLAICWLGFIFWFHQKQINDCLNEGISLELCQEVADLH